jgi:predicted nicotinamide N-methyase
MEPFDRIRRHTVVAATPLVPELRLHLITAECALWHATEAEAQAAGVPEPYWAFAWPGGQALARFVLDTPALVRGRRVLDCGTGSAIEGLAALRAGAASVLAADLDPLAGAAATLNAALNGVSGLSTTTEDLVGTKPAVDVVLAGDVFYDRELAARGLAWLRALAGSGVEVYAGDPSRGFLDVSTLEPVACYAATHDGELDPARVRPTTVFRIR